MDNNQLKRLLIVFGIIFFIAAGLTALNYFQSNSSTKVFLSSDQQSSVDKISINKGNTIDLTKVDNQWKASDDNFKNSYDADNNKIEGILNSLSSAQVTNISSSNPENYSIFNIDDANGVTVGLFNGTNKITTIILGKATSTGNYLRTEGDANVYLVDKNLTDSITLTLNDYRDKTLSAGDINNLDKVIAKGFEIDSSNGTFVLSDNSKTLNQDSTNTFLNNLINFSGVSFASNDDSKKLTGKKPDLTFTINFKNGNSYGFDIYSLSDGNYYAARKKDGAVLIINKSQFDNVNKNLSDLT